MKGCSLVLTIIFYIFGGINVLRAESSNTLKNVSQSVPIVNTKATPQKSNPIDEKVIDGDELLDDNFDEDIVVDYHLNLAETIDKILPTVVSINALKNTTYSDGEYYSDSSSEMKSLGSGFLISEDGYIITNNHVIDGAEKINIKLKGSETNFPAEIIGVDSVMDIALLKISVKVKLPFVEFDETNSKRIGDTVIVVGNPYNLGISVSTGIISALNRNLKMSSFDNFIQTDASINKGNSGGPMFNLSGKVIGLTSTIYSPDGENVGIGFAMPVNDLLPIVEELKKYGYVRRGWIGATTENVQREIFDALNSQVRRHGVIVTDIAENSPADRSGLRISDVILTYNGKKVRNVRDFSLLVSSTEIGSNVALGVLRNNKVVILNVKIDETKQNYKYDSQYEALLSKAIEVFDMVLIPVNKESKKRFNIVENDGMYVLRVKKGGLADKKGIRTGDIVLSVNQDKTNDGNVILENIHKAELNNMKYVFLIIKGSKNTLIFMPIRDNRLSNIEL